MSSSAFFIEAAANTVRLLSAQAQARWPIAVRIVKAAKVRQGDASWRSMHVRGRYPRANQAVVMVECDRRKRRSVNPADLRSSRHRSLQAYSIVKAWQRLRGCGCYRWVRRGQYIAAAPALRQGHRRFGFAVFSGGFGWSTESLNQ